MPAEVAVGESIHETVAVRIKSFRRARLWDAVSGCIGNFGSGFPTRFGKSGDTDVGWTGELRQRGITPVHNKFPEVQRLIVIVERHEVFRRAARRQGGAIEIRRQHGSVIRSGLCKALHPGGCRTLQHGSSFDHANACSDVSLVHTSLHVAHVITVGPDGPFRVIRNWSATTT